MSPVDGYVAVTSNCHDIDVTNVPVDGYIRVLSDRQEQPNHDPAILRNIVPLNLQVHSSGNTPHLIPKGNKNITELNSRVV